MIKPEQRHQLRELRTLSIVAIAALLTGSVIGVIVGLMIAIRTGKDEINVG